MPIINQDDTKYSPFELIQFDINANAPAGVHLAMCVDIIYQEGFTEKGYDGLGVQTKNKIVFLFGIIVEGKQFFQATWDYNFSHSEKGNFIKFLKQWTGENNIPKGMNTDSLIGKFATITITDKKSINTGTVYSNLHSIAPPMDEEGVKSFPGVSDFKLHGERRTPIPAEMQSTGTKKDPF